MGQFGGGVQAGLCDGAGAGGSVGADKARISTQFCFQNTAAPSEAPLEFSAKYLEINHAPYIHNTEYIGEYR